ncbi:unnamed protein product, partial [Lampetra fluviatilis]
DEVSGQGYERFDDGGDGGEEEGGERWTPNQDPSQVDEDARSDATEGHDEEGGEERGYQMASDTGPAPQAPPPGPPLEAALEASGHGAAQWRLLAALGPAVAADGAERLLVWLALPSAERELCGRDAKGWLCVLVQLSLVLGSVGCGVVSDLVGRRKALLTALTTSTIFSIFSMLSTSYGAFLTCRMLGALGMGGSGRHEAAWMALKQIHDTNAKGRGHPEEVYPVTDLSQLGVTLPVPQGDLNELKSETGTWLQRLRAFRSLPVLFSPELKASTLWLLPMWFNLSFR